MSRSRKFMCRLAAALAVIGSASPAWSEQPIPADAVIAADPAVKRGTMTNGLRYAIMPNASPAGGVSIRLALKVGSYDEADDELGMAHFVEHMAFRSTRQAPGGILDNRFAALGVSLGRDQNAVTGLDRTVYGVDLPAGKREGISAVLGWMRGAADGILFTPAAVDVERGVVKAEKEARNNPLAIMQREAQRFQGPELRSANRDPGGTEASLQAATPARLQAFYDRWYRPDNAFLVIVGDAPAEELERAAVEAFGTWAAKGAAPPRAVPTALREGRGLEALVRSNPGLPSALSACRVAGPVAIESAPLQRMRRELHTQIWTGILNRRLVRLAARPGSPLLGAVSAVNMEAPDSSIACLIVMPTAEKWQAALSTAQAELRRLGESGPTDLEVFDMIEAYRSGLRAGVSLAATRVSPLIADEIAQAHLTGRIFLHPREAMNSFEIAAAGIDAEDVKQAYHADWKGNGPLLIATAPEAPAQADLLAAWQANENAAPLEAYADRADSKWRYQDFGKPGRVVKREAVADGDFLRFHFANGVVLNFKRTGFQANAAEIRVGFGHGERALDSRTRLPAALAAGFFPMGGLGKMDFEEVGSAFTNSTWNFNLEIRPTTYLLSSSTLSNQVAGQMQLLAAYMTDPGFRSEMNDKLPTALDAVYRMFPTDPNRVAVDALERQLHPDKLSLPPYEQMATYTAADFERLLKPVLTRSPVEVTIVGDIDEEDAKRAVAASFGALRRRAPLVAPGGEGPFRQYPALMPSPVRASHQGPPEKAAALLLWPLYVASPQRRSEEYAIGLVATIFQTRLLQVIRGQMGKVYSPSVSNEMPDDADQGYLAASIEATPADLDGIVAAARRIAAELAAGRISQQEVDEARTPLVADRLQAQGRNEAWAGVIAHSVRHPEALDELIRFQPMMEALTLDDVRRAAATWLTPQPMLSTAYPGMAPGSAVAARPR